MPNELQVKQFRYSSDNLGYVVFSKQFALAVDGGAVSDILEFIAARNLTLAYIAHTHSHPDHTVGTRRLMDQTGATRLTSDKLLEDEGVALESALVQVYQTPGHTRDSLVFHWDGFLITGDTLFNGTVGNCFSGDLRAFYQSISHLRSFPNDTVVYAGHDYVEASMQFARTIEPENTDIEPYLEKYNPDHVFATLEDELKVDPFLRFNDEKIISILNKKGLPTKTEIDRWTSLISLM